MGVLQTEQEEEKLLDTFVLGYKITLACEHITMTRFKQWKQQGISPELYCNESEYTESQVSELV
jgi:hypothetical protein